MCQLIERGDIAAGVGIELDGGLSATPLERTGYVGDMVASILSYVGLPFVQVLFVFFRYI